MGKEPNTVKANLVGKFRNILAQDSQVEFQPSDFHADTDSTILVRERTKGSNLRKKDGESDKRDVSHHSDTPRKNQATEDLL